MTAAIPVPQTLDTALSPAWLTLALAEQLGGAQVTQVTQVECREVIRTVATKVRFGVTAADGRTLDLCLKGLLDADEQTARGGPTMIREADFYRSVAPVVDVVVPTYVTGVIDHDARQAVIIMQDLIAEGATFCSAAEPFSPDQAAASLDQIARLHAGRDVLHAADWIGSRIAGLAERPHMTADQLQDLLDGPRGEGLPASVRSAERLFAAMRGLAEAEAQQPQFLIHGDAHAGNIFRTPNGATGLIDWQLLQRGGWALDVAYHIAAVLPVAVAEREERALLRHYLATMASLGCTMPDDEDAWAQYRRAPIYGFYLWAITRRVEPATINLFVDRLGNSVLRHASHQLNGVAS